MDSEKEIKPGDYVMYKESKEVPIDENGEPLTVMIIEYKKFRIPTVIYNNGEFDWLKDVEKSSKLYAELS